MSSPAQADVIFEIRAIAPSESSYKNTISYNPQVILTVRDPKTSAVLWTESANVRAAGIRGRRDRQFDLSVAVLVDKLAAVTGQPLTEAQTRAIAKNSKMSTATKIFIGLAIAGAAAATIVGIHMATHHPRLTNPPPPVLPPSPVIP